MADLLELGPWGWVILGLVLLVFEMIVPGTFMLWVGIAAIFTGLMFVIVPMAWQVQALTFAVLCAVAFVGWRRYMREKESESPLLNRAHEGLIGREFLLENAIEHGFGRVRLGDGTWTVKGPDLAAGARVKVVAVEGSVLRVTPVA